MDNVQNSYSPIYTQLDAKAAAPTKYSNNQVDIKELYKPEELDAIISKFDCLHPTSPNGERKCEFDMVYLPDKEYLVINNKNMTNDTVEINKNGKAISVGSWHRKELDGNFSDIINDVKLRLEASKQNNETKLTSQLDSMAELGKSQVYSSDKNQQI